MGEEDIVRRVNLGSGIRKEEVWEGGGVEGAERCPLQVGEAVARDSGQLVRRRGWGWGLLDELRWRGLKGEDSGHRA